jgi:hypothetical protein
MTVTRDLAEATDAVTHDFDFLWGNWTIANERLVSRLTGSDEWEYFEALGECWPILGGAGNVDTFRPVGGETSYEGASVRVFDPVSRQWSIYWADNVRGQLFPPVFGSFADGIGRFFGDDEHAGQPVTARFIWSEITPDSARWEQAFSIDGGETWETNWVMKFTRRV